MTTTSRETVWRAVRCCCQPTKVLGFVQLPIDHGKTLTLRDHDGHCHVAQIRMAWERVLTIADTGMKEPATFEHAIYSEDRGVEFWRTIPEFVEAKP